MSTLQFVPIESIDAAEMLDLMNHPQVGAYLPLLEGSFTMADYEAFITAKKQMWARYGYGPWAFMIEGKFAGWGGLQYEEGFNKGEADFALVLHPNYWGWGLRIFNRVKNIAFGPMKLKSITALLPPSRPNSKAIERLGFIKAGTTQVAGQVFGVFKFTKN